MKARIGDKPSSLTTVFYYLFLGVGAIVSVFPFYWMFVIGSNERGAASHIPPIITIGNQFLNNFNRALEKTEFGTAFGNSIFVSTIVTSSVVIFCSLAGYAFAKYNFKYKKFLFIFVLGTLFVPQQLSVLPTYVIMAKLQWIDTYKALIRSEEHTSELQ